MFEQAQQVHRAHTATTRTLGTHTEAQHEHQPLTTDTTNAPLPGTPGVTGATVNRHNGLSMHKRSKLGRSL